VNVAPETCRAKKTKKNKLDLLHLVGILFINGITFKHTFLKTCQIFKKLKVRKAHKRRKRRRRMVFS
jgi:hypothetical protein